MKLRNDEKYPQKKNDTLKNWRELKLPLKVIEIIQFLFRLQLAIVLFFLPFIFHPIFFQK